MTQHRGSPPLIDHLNPAQAEAEAALNAQLWDLAVLCAPVDQTVEYRSRRPDDGRQYVRLTNGESFYIAKDVVDAYIEQHKPQRATLKRQRRIMSRDMYSRGKIECAAVLAIPGLSVATAVHGSARESHGSRPGHRRVRSTRAGPSDDDGPAEPPAPSDGAA